MTLKIKILIALSILLNVFILFYGFISWMDAYNGGRLIASGVVMAAGFLNLYLIVYELRSTERRLEKRVRIARMEKELADLGK